MLSLAGMPLTAGFIGKFFIFRAGAGAALWGLLIVFALTSAMSLYYYLRVIITMYRVDVAPYAAALATSPGGSAAGRLPGRPGGGGCRGDPGAGDGRAGGLPGIRCSG